MGATYRPAEIGATLWLALLVPLSIALLAASFLPGPVLEALVARAAQSGSASTFAQDLVAHIDQRLRLSAGPLLALAVGLAALRAHLADLLRPHPFAIDVTRRDAVAIVAIVVPLLLALAMRMFFVNQRMRYDESATFNDFASRSLPFALSFYPDPNNHLLNTLLVHVAFAALVTSHGCCICPR